MARLTVDAGPISDFGRGFGLPVRLCRTSERGAHRPEYESSFRTKPGGQALVRSLGERLARSHVLVMSEATPAHRFFDSNAESLYLGGERWAAIVLAIPARHVASQWMIWNRCPDPGALAERSAARVARSADPENESEQPCMDPSAGFHTALLHGTSACGVDAVVRGGIDCATGSECDARPMAAPTERRRSNKPNRTRARRRGAKDSSSSAVGPIRALAVSKPPLADRAADDPLSPLEVQEMKEHFRFLRTHRKLLKLRLNAAEDLLLNGVREPTHRGVCQHLLAKVEKDRVLAVTERLSPQDSAKLLAGILRFAPEVSYVLRYLECVSDASSRPEAAQALAQALKRIQFTETSHAQMRQILNLIVQVFPREELPVLLFNWLYNAAFRSALDRSSEVLPDSLRQVVVPLRSAHRALVGRDGKGLEPALEEGPGELANGLRLLLGAARATLRELPESSRRRLLELGLGFKLVKPDELRGLAAVFEDLHWRNASERSDVALRLAGAFLTAGDEAGARRQLVREHFEGEAAVQAKRWLRLLEAPRLGNIAIAPRQQGRSRRSKQLPEPERPDAAEAALAERWLIGFHLSTQVSVRLRRGLVTERERFAALVSLWQRALVPGVMRPFECDVAGDQPYIAVRLVGRSLARFPASFEQSPGVLRDACTEVCLLLHALAVLGICLPDAHAKRFSLDDGGRVWLTDLWGARDAPVSEALSRHAEQARILLRQLLQNRPGYGFDTADSLAELVSTLETWAPKEAE